MYRGISEEKNNNTNNLIYLCLHISDSLRTTVFLRFPMLLTLMCLLVKITVTAMPVSSNTSKRVDGGNKGITT